MKSGDYQILWKRKVGGNGSFVIGKPWQHCSRIPRTQVFESKDSFLAGFRRMQQRYDKKMKMQEYNPNLSQLSSNGDDLMYFIPKTYQLVEESDCNLFEMTILQDKTIGQNHPWPLKKVSVNNGRGVEAIPPDSPALYTAVA